jgi:hypothetical protein
MGLKADPQALVVTRWLARGAFGALAGIALSALGEPAIGSWVTVGSLLVTIVSLHKFGRLGPEPGAGRGRARTVHDADGAVRGNETTHR